MDTNPISHTCPQCQAKPGEWCTQGGRRRELGFHKARELAAKGSKATVQDSTGMFKKRTK
jgi:hypothetical protein